MNEIEITNDDLSLLLEVADENEVYYECLEGCLLDNFIFYNANIINIGGKSAKHIIIKERFLNTWSSDLVLVMTNSDIDIEEFKIIFDN